MHINRWSWVALGVGAYLAFALVSLPAGTVYRWFAPDNVQLAGIQGTLWSGRAAAGSFGNFVVQDLRWNVHPLPLLVLRLSADVETRLADGFVNTSVSAGPGGVTLSNLRASLSLPALRGVLPIGGTRGLASADFRELTLTDGWPTAAVGELRLAELETPPLVPGGNRQLIELGNYLVQFQESANGVSAAFNDTGGPLEVSGTLTLEPNRAYTLQGFVKPRPSAAEALVQGLEIMTGEPDESGRRSLTLTGSL